MYEGPAKPYCYRGKAYRRADSSTVEVSRLEYNRLALKGLNMSFDALESLEQPSTFACLAGELQDKLGINQLDKATLISLELRNLDGACNNAASLLAGENVFPGIDMARFGESINVMRSRRTFAGVSVLRQMHDALAFFEENYLYEEIVGIDRVRRELIPYEAFREAVVNALVHRCWDVPAHIRVAMYPNRVEVVSPGGLPDGVTEDEYLSGGPSIARNPILANVFFRLGYIERFGTGIPRIVEAYRDALVSPSFTVSASSIAVTLPVLIGMDLSSDEQAVLMAIRRGEDVSSAEISARVGFSKGKTVRMLNALIEYGLVRRMGAARAVRYQRR